MTGFAVYEQTNQTDFDEGTYTNTEYNGNAVVLSSGQTSGNYTSKIFDGGASTQWNNISWVSNAIGELPDNGIIETGLGGANMAGNVLLMHLNEASGTIVDTSGEGNNGTYNGALYSQTGKLNTAIGFDGVDDYVDIGNIGSIKTVSFWIKTNSITEKIMNLNLGGWTCGDTLTDSRDSKSYATVLIGTQCWMAEHINYGTMTAGINDQGSDCPSVAATEKYCYSDDEAFCTSEGALYQWAQAMCGTASCNGTGVPPDDKCSTPVQGICPSGWHIPSHYEYTTLEKNVGSNPGAFPYDESTSGWLGTDEGTNLKDGGSSGFEGLLAGCRYTIGSFYGRGAGANVWSSLESGTSAWRRNLGSGRASVYRGVYGKLFGFSVRCIKDDVYDGTYIDVNNGTINTNQFDSPTIYVDGVESSSITTGWHFVTVTTNTSVTADNLTIGKIDSEYFNGKIDEVTIYNRALSDTGVLDNYKRGALRLNLTARSCDDNACLGESFIDITDISSQDLSLDDNNYFQYKFLFQTDNSSYSPELYNVSLDYTQLTDSDNDGIEDLNDTLIGTEENIIQTGISNLNITIGKNSTNGTFAGKQDIVFYDGTDIIMNFTHNFSKTNLDLSKINIIKSSNYIITNFSNQLQNTKTLFINDNNFVSLCVKDSEISSVSEISSGCNQANETDFTSCLGNLTGITINNITCYDEGTKIRIENLNYSGIKGTPKSSGNRGGGGGGAGSSLLIIPNETNETKEPLFDIEIKLKDMNLTEEQALILYIDLINKNPFEEIDVKIEYHIYDLDNNELFYSSETKAIYDILSFKKVFPEIELTPGEYIIKVEIIYNENQKAVSEYQFKIDEDKQITIIGSPIKQHYYKNILYILIGIIFFSGLWFVNKKFIYPALFGFTNIKTILETKKPGQNIRLKTKINSLGKNKQGYILKLKDETGKIYGIYNHLIKGYSIIRGQIQLNEEGNKFINLKKHKAINKKNG